jgi:hypothetical protein
VSSPGAAAGSVTGSASRSRGEAGAMSPG